ncbi:Alpha-D-glucose 1-phosphate phosphatase YihX [BD1-7 clade bacterium]|uniref:Alpha-D-glucose 1-phosphate phosphatase YihX n=1 Tax=BD1-7 clade bacterium TaxID=2029982 RepID=A0A5S9PFI1_9GAMM|nr:Alpha-D-glucose 1-phosphate phosphatase YihX [BD1-7 clade bacterium]CAA0102485.1 Alpha-D-glucose 1-phosphate phosphatase YihX [BD1-7 clade bacterium]
MAINNVIFDLGAVCLTWDPHRVIEEVSSDQSVQKQLRQDVFGHPDWLSMDDGSLAEATARKRFIKRTDLEEETIDQALYLAKEILQEIPSTMFLIDQLHEAGMPLYCLSNMSRETFQYISHKPFLKVFRGRVISGFEGTRKPFDDIYECILNRYDLIPSETLFIDDSKDNIDAANSIGINTVWFNDSKIAYQEIRDIMQLRP